MILNIVYYYLKITNKIIIYKYINVPLANFSTCHRSIGSVLMFITMSLNVIISNFKLFHFIKNIPLTTLTFKMFTILSNNSCDR